MTVAEGEILGILGPNGSGKTTTVECIAGLRRPDSGTVRVAGLDPAEDRDALTRLVGVQREALDLYASFYDNPVDGIALAERLGLGEKLDTRYAALSAGQQQRLAIALALVGRPRVALLDELSTGLDPRSRRAVWSVVEDARAAGATIILVTHLMEEARHLCDRLAVINRGRVAAVDTPEGIIGRTASPVVMSFRPTALLDPADLTVVAGVSDARVREDGRFEVSVTDDAVPHVLDLLSARDVRPQRIRIVDSTLEDAFLDLTAEEN